MTTEQTATDRILAACTSLGLTLRTEFVPFSKSRHAGEPNLSLNWRVTLERNGRDVLTTDYSAGVAHCPAYKASVANAGNANSILRSDAIRREIETGKAVTFSRSGIAMVQSGKEIRPEAASVIYSLVMDSSVLDAGTFEQWAADCGYDPDSRKAEATHRACLEIALQMRAAIGDAGLETLRTACEDY